MALHQLTDRAVKTAKPTDKERLIADGGGLFLRVLPTGFKSWLLVYSFDGKRSKLALGSATDVSLAVARDTAAQERARIAAGADPRVALMEREAEQAAQREALIAAEIQRKREAATLQEMFDAWIANGVQRADDNAELRRTGDDKSEWRFPARHQKGHINVKTVSKQVGDRQMQFKNRKPLKNRRNDDTLVLSRGENGEWTPHDLRRTAATMLQALGVSLDVIDRCQNHVMPGSKIRRHYMHHDYADEKRDAWCKLGARIDAILAEA